MAEVVDTDKGYRQILSSIGDLEDDPFVLVGVPEGAGASDDGTTLAVYAAANEFGVPHDSVDKRIPERSFLRSATDENREFIATRLAKATDDQIMWKRKIGDSLGLLGDVMVGKVQAKIKSNIPPKNAESTIRQKGSGKLTLKNEGRLDQSITRQVVAGGAQVQTLGLGPGGG